MLLGYEILGRYITGEVSMRGVGNPQSELLAFVNVIYTDFVGDPEGSADQRPLGCDKMGQNVLCRRILATRYTRPCRAPVSMIRSLGRRT